MKKIFTAIIVFLLAAPVSAQEIRLFDPEVLGHSSEGSLKLLLSAKSKAIEPIFIQIGIKERRYSGAMLHYPPEVDLEEARTSLNIKYKKYEQSSFKDNPKMGLWRVTDRRIAIQLTKHEEGIRIIYLPFSGSEER